MNRSVLSLFVLLAFGLLYALPGCGGDEKPDDSEGEAGGESTSSEKPGGTSTTAETGSEKPGHEGHNHESTELPPENITGPRKPIAMASTPKRDSIAGRWLIRLVQIIELSLIHI